MVCSRTHPTCRGTSPGISIKSLAAKPSRPSSRHLPAARAVARVVVGAARSRISTAPPGSLAAGRASGRPASRRHITLGTAACRPTGRLPRQPVPAPARARGAACFRCVTVPGTGRQATTAGNGTASGRRQFGRMGRSWASVVSAVAGSPPLRRRAPDRAAAAAANSPGAALKARTACIATAVARRCTFAATVFGGASGRSHRDGLSGSPLSLRRLGPAATAHAAGPSVCAAVGGRALPPGISLLDLSQSHKAAPWRPTPRSA